MNKVLSYWPQRQNKKNSFIKSFLIKLLHFLPVAKSVLCLVGNRATLPMEKNWWSSCLNSKTTAVKSSCFCLHSPTKSPLCSHLMRSTHSRHWSRTATSTSLQAPILAITPRMPATNKVRSKARNKNGWWMRFHSFNMFIHVVFKGEPVLNDQKYKPSPDTYKQRICWSESFFGLAFQLYFYCNF